MTRECYKEEGKKSPRTLARNKGINMLFQWRRFATALGLSVLLGGTATSVQALSIDFEPESSVVNIADGQVTVELFADFTADATVGGGIDLFFSGPIALASFTPSDYFNTLDPVFSGFGEDSAAGFPAAGDFLVAIGSFAGLTGGKLGDLTFELIGAGTATISTANNIPAGGFFSAGSFTEQSVAFNGATIEVVPVPAAAWLLGSALVALGGMRRRLQAG